MMREDHTITNSSARTRAAIYTIVLPTLIVVIASSAGAHIDAPADAFANLYQDANPHGWADLWRRWTLDPGVLVSVGATGALYALGLFRLWRTTHVGSGISRLHAWCFAGGWLSLVVALVSPLHTWGEVLFSVHMCQHEILMLIAAPLMVLGQPLIAFLWALPLSWRKALASFAGANGIRHIWLLVSAPFAAWLIHAAALWMWHFPALFQATLRSNIVHALQHLSFFFSALLFWWAIIQGSLRCRGYGAAILYLFTTALHTSLLGALLTFSDKVWYPSYALTSWQWGLTALEDQQLGGLIMWVPAGFVYVFAGLAFFVGWMRESERRVMQWDLSAQREVTP